MGQRIVQVDSFTDKPFAGNPAGVCILDSAADESWMQAVAMEMNLAETAFLYPDNSQYHLRWFTPVAEVELCGHATLAAAHVLWEENQIPLNQTIRFDTLSGQLSAIRQGELIVLNFPATIEKEVTAPEGLHAALGALPQYVGRSKFDYLVELKSEESVRRLKPDMTALAALPVRGVIVTAKSTTGEYDFVSRFFAPKLGIPEDPVTGSAHCTLGPYWKWKLNKSKLVAYQASARGGIVYLQVNSDRVSLGGQAVTVFRAELDEGAMRV